MIICDEITSNVLSKFKEVSGSIYLVSCNVGIDSEILYVVDKNHNDKTVEAIIRIESDEKERDINATLIFENGKWVIDIKR